ncbi:chromate transporter [Paenibacillus thalictri]|uniref:Chromate transporter n=1 Tax=Paenibacillus thalictri TaxID=2527873 RepID=A0A4Q9DL01_9BACL|nr:chromate transporter [Paenibacillus thalictri]TBL75606.1 chromate transporter [Paenibacillus thalictri]
MGSIKWGQLAPIFWTFFKISPVTFGGGYAMIPVIEEEVVAKRKWISSEEMLDVLSIAGSAPGGIGVNAAAFIGYRLAGIAGASAAVLGIGLPTFLIIFIFSLVLGLFRSNPMVEAAFKGIHAAVIALIVIAAYRMGKSAVKDKTTLVTAIVALLLLIDFNVHPILMIVLGLFVGVVLVQFKVWFGMEVKQKKVRVTKTTSGYTVDDYFIGDGI